MAHRADVKGAKLASRFGHSFLFNCRPPATTFTSVGGLSLQILRRAKGPATTSWIHHSARLLKSDKQSSLPNLNHGGGVVAGKAGEVKKRLFERFLDYLQGYTDKVLKHLPEPAVRIYRVFSGGAKGLLVDMREFLWVYHVLSSTSNWSKACKTLSRKQLELYLTLPSELIRVAPVLAISAFPFAQNVVFPLAMMYPKRLLSFHFWSDEVKAEVARDRLKVRHRYYRHVFRHLNVASNSLRTGDEAERLLRKALGTLAGGVGQHSGTDVVLGLVPVFEERQPADGQRSLNLCLSQLSGPHVQHLLRIHNSDHVGLVVYWFPRKKLQLYANMIMEIDKAIQRETPEALDQEALLSCCRVRGLNLDGGEVDEEEARKYLTDWLRVSSALSPASASLLLHLPIFLGYNHRSRHLDDTSVI